MTYKLPPGGATSRYFPHPLLKTQQSVQPLQPSNPRTPPSMPHATLQVLAHRLLRWFGALFQTAPPDAVAYDYFAEHEIAGYDNAMREAAAAPEPERIDDATWRDLDVRAYLKRMAAPASLLARQVLYHRLRTGQPDAAFTVPLQDAIQQQHPATAALHIATEPMRQVLRSISVDLTPVLWGNGVVAVAPWTRYVWLAVADALGGDPRLSGVIICIRCAVSAGVCQSTPCGTASITSSSVLMRTTGGAIFHHRQVFFSFIDKRLYALISAAGCQAGFGPSAVAVFGKFHVSLTPIMNNRGRDCGTK